MDTWRTQIHLDCDQLLHPAPRKASEHDSTTPSRRRKSPLPACVECGEWTIRKQMHRTEYPSPIVGLGRQEASWGSRLSHWSRPVPEAALLPCENGW